MELSDCIEEARVIVQICHLLLGRFACVVLIDSPCGATKDKYKACEAAQCRNNISP